MGALDNYSLVFVIFINFFGQLKDWVGQVLFLVSCPKGQVEKYVNVEACIGANLLRQGYNTLSNWLLIVSAFISKLHEIISYSLDIFGVNEKKNPFEKKKDYFNLTQ